MSQNKDLNNQPLNIVKNIHHKKTQNSNSTQYNSSSANNIMISLVNSEEESDDDNEMNIESNQTLTKSNSLTHFSCYTDRSINNINEVGHNKIQNIISIFNKSFTY